MALYSWFNRNQSDFSSITEQQEVTITINKKTSEKTSEKTQNAWPIITGNNTLNKDAPNTQLTH